MILWLLALAANARTCDPEAYLRDPGEWTDLGVQDFQDTAIVVDPTYPTETSPWQIDGLDLWGDARLTYSWGIPGMDASDGSNRFVATAADLWIRPPSGTTDIGFRYGFQDLGFGGTATVTLEDGSSRTFDLNEPDSSGFGWSGFFGYCTGGLGIDTLHVLGPDGGVDDIHCEWCGTGGPPDTDVPDTDVADTAIAETDLPPDTDAVDTDVTDTDPPAETDPPDPDDDTGPRDTGEDGPGGCVCVCATGGTLPAGIAAWLAAVFVRRPRAPAMDA